MPDDALQTRSPRLALDAISVASRQARSSRWLAGAFVLAVVCSSGCMQRRMTIVSNPPGATVYVDTKEIGQTPVSHDFLYYGTREIKLVKDGYETLTVMQPMATPWYQIPPLDFFSDNMAFGEVRDERLYRYDLAPVAQVSFDTVIARGEQLRRGSVAPTAATVTGPPVITYPPPNPPSALTTAPPAFGFPPLPGATPAPAAPTKPRRAWPTPNE